tara:strand:- start:95 stop:547 length:453 start_codon:yes stop_codon:yes gene_type:complete
VLDNLKLTLCASKEQEKNQWVKSIKASIKEFQRQTAFKMKKQKEHAALNPEAEGDTDFATGESSGKGAAKEKRKSLKDTKQNKSMKDMSRIERDREKEEKKQAEKDAKEAKEAKKKGGKKDGEESPARPALNRSNTMGTGAFDWHYNIFG